uniref:Mtr2 n=1 Tax=Chaetomium thermophilum (strain DSM 1495 / CBS 144.50 / IMI 039719) TaxID=759272 RepID=UPI0006454558|nr:Chain B, Sac3N peptide bound to Mex67:Mtr2 [Thermochaetoides thermophila DSM 1495]4X2M_A Chain A, Mtr2 [Thermochaetoides thermophila DSM 1495]4X2M_B Chain B, Mtr2 [Thermochaetoides thermophila DSM 1495]4X2O_B Chain B, Sac3N peptide bound to Mex67:Mtr2 [Thermochaetoides thermophila DSM 1495]
MLSRRYAAKSFVEWYYRQINENKPVASGYVNNNATYTKAGHPPADITINGRVVATPEEWDTMLKEQRAQHNTSSSSTLPIGRKPVRYDVDCFDVHVINADYRFAAPQRMIEQHAPTDGVRMMMALTVSGSVYFGASPRSTDDYVIKQHFNDVFILVPNWDVLEKPGARSGRKYLIASHKYRAY